MATESFFSNASLAYLASAGAGKDGKAYSIKPTDGTGDFTFSRGSNLAATRVGADGLIEKGRENLFTYSNDFSNANWKSSGTTETSGQSGYDGSSDAWLLSAANVNGFIYRNDITSFSGVMTISVYAKKGTADGIRLRFNQTTDVNLYINLAAGAIIGAFSPGIAYAIEDALNGWYRIQMSFIASGPSDVRIYPTNATGTSIAGTIYIQDAQLEIGLAATDYIESGATTGKAGLLEDEPRFDYSGGATCPSLLLEPSRTQSITQSEYFASWVGVANVSIQSNNATSPEGLLNASSIYPTTSGSCFLYEDTIIYTSGLTYTYSVFAKSNGKDILQLCTSGASFSTPRCNFDLSLGTFVNNGFESAGIEDYGNGWYRCYVVETAVSTAESRIIIALVTSLTSGRLASITANGTDGVLIYGAVSEQGSYPTSYIPNHSGGTITRGTDEATDAGDASTFNSTEGVLYAELSFANDNSFKFISLNSGSSTNRVSFYSNSPSFISVSVKNSGGNQFTGNFSIDSTINHKIALKYKENDFALWIDGQERLTDSSGTTFSSSTLTTLDFSDGNNNSDFNGFVKQVLVFEEVLSDADLATLTTL